MTITTTQRLLAGLSLAAMAVAAPAAYAQAAKAAPDPAPGAPAATASADSGEITVTARRISERLADVPASITAFSQRTLDNSGAQRVDDFVRMTPGVSIVSSTAEAGDNQINIRGMNGARDAESSVALVVDGILKTNSAVLNQDQGALTQVEILKGPQGALYGRNAAAGAIVIQTRKPGDTLAGGIKASYGNNHTYNGKAYLSGPLSPGVGFVLSGDYHKTDGFYRNLYLGNSAVVDNQESWNIDGRIVAALGDATTLDAKAHYGALHGASINYNAVFNLPAFGPAFDQSVNGHVFRYYGNIVPTNTQTSKEGSLKLDHDFGSSALTAWVNYSDVFNDLVADGTSADFQRFTSAKNAAAQSTVNACFASTAANTGYPLNSPAFIGASPFASVFGPYSPTTCDGLQYQRRTQQDVSGEVRLVSKGAGPLAWQLGGYFLHIDRQVAINLAGDSGHGAVKQIYGAPNSINPTTQLYDDKFLTNVYAPFASGEFKPTDALDLGLALRYDVEERRDDNLVPLVADPFTGGPINPGQANGAIPAKSATFRQLEPKVTARYTFAPAATIYANWGVGFKSGGFNNQGAAATVASAFNVGLGSEVKISDQYRKERSSAWEAGLKGKVGPVDYSVAGYYTQVRDMQFFEFFVGGFGLLRVVSNIDRVDLTGVEANANVRVIKGWDVFGSVNFTDSKIKANRSRPSTVGNKSPYTPDYTINVGSQQVAPLTSSINLLVRADYRITGPTWFHTVQAQSTPTLFGAPGNYSKTQRAAFGVLDLRVGLQTRTWNITAYANNALDTRYLNEAIPAVEFGGTFISPGERASYGVEVGTKF